MSWCFHWCIIRMFCACHRIPHPYKIPQRQPRIWFLSGASRSVWIHLDTRFQHIHVPCPPLHVAVRPLPAPQPLHIPNQIHRRSFWLLVQPLHVAHMLWLPLNLLPTPAQALALRPPPNVPPFLRLLPKSYIHFLYQNISAPNSSTPRLHAH
jgi:hypothetical protein